MQNTVPALENEVADRSLAGRRGQYAAEVRRLLDGAFVVMRRTGTVEPAVRDVVAEAGLSNQAFYRHFPSKDALLVAVLADGRRQLVTYLEHRLTGVRDPAERMRQWIEGVMEQARHPDAAAATLPFVVNANRLGAAFPREIARSREELIATLGTDIPIADAELVHDLVMRRMEDALMRGRVPTDTDVDHLVAFCLAGVTRRADTAEPGTAQRGSHRRGT
ncbi:MAG: TetR/AcrR family transcriptional regulator [Actinomycetota bacterium]|nr:TetR/AcrR family transcriptional regulator [Actinomycetota bacterium]